HVTLALSEKPLSSAISLSSRASLLSVSLFLFNHTATTEIYTLSLHDALPISDIIRNQLRYANVLRIDHVMALHRLFWIPQGMEADRKSTRLNFSHVKISYAVFCLKKKKKLII